MKKKNDKPKIRKGFLIVLIFFIVWTLWSWVPVTERIELELLKDSGAGVRIALITDVHSCYYGKDQNWLIKRIDKEHPDIILLAGDIFDDVLKDKNTKLLMENLVKKYPCYYVTGNHEYWSHRADEMKEYMDSIGVHVLAGDCETVTIVETRIPENGKNTRKQLEVDFVINRGSERYYIQSACALPTQEKIDQEQASLIRIPDSFKKIIVVNGTTPLWRNEQGITFMGLYDFFLNDNSLNM